MEKIHELAVHVLLFECPRCGCPVPSAITSDTVNLEPVDAHLVSVGCSNCHWSGQDLGLNAKHHLVVDWTERTTV